MSTRRLSVRVEGRPLLLPPIERLLIPLPSESDGPLSFDCQTGDTIHRGQVIARFGPPSRQALIHAPADGRLGQRCTAWIESRGVTPALELVVTDTAAPARIADQIRRDNAAASPSGTADEPLLRAGFVFDAESQWIPGLLAADPPPRIETLIIRCIADEPGRLDSDLWRQRAGQDDLEPADIDRLISQAARLASAVSAARVMFALPHWIIAARFRRWRTAAAAARDAQGRPVRVIVRRVWSEYPKGLPIVLTRTLTGLETPPGASTRAAGAWVVDLSALRALETSDRTGQPRLAATLFVGGARGVAQPCDAPIGAPIKALFNGMSEDEPGAEIIAGGWLSGVRVDHPDAVVDGNATCFWQLPPLGPPTSPCIRCGSCIDACPIGLSPALLFERISESVSQCARLMPQACIRCGMCSYVCPSGLPLASEISLLSDVCGDLAAAREGANRPPASADPAPRSAMVTPLLPDRPALVSGRTDRQMIDAVWLAAMLPALAGCALFGPAAAVLAITCVLTSLLTEFLLRRATRRNAAGGLAHAALTGLLVYLTLPVTIPLWMAIAGAVAATGVARFACGGVGRYLWQPAVAGRVFVQLLLVSTAGGGDDRSVGPVLAPQRLIFGDITAAQNFEPGRYPGWRDAILPAGSQAMRYERPATTIRRAADAGVVEGEHPLLRLVRDGLPPWEDTLLGATPGGCGETCAIAIMMAGLYLIYRGALRWELPVAVLSGAFLIAAICPVRSGPPQYLEWFPVRFVHEGTVVGLCYALYHLTSGQLMLAAFLLAGDPTTSPLTRRGQFIFGLGVGAITIFMRLYGLTDTEGYWAVLIMNSLTPMIDLRTQPRVLGTAA